MVYHLWTYDKEKQTLSLMMNGKGPRMWGTPGGSRAWGDRNMEHGTYRGFQCECVTPCVYKKRRYRFYHKC